MVESGSTAIAMLLRDGNDHSVIIDPLGCREASAVIFVGLSDIHITITMGDGSESASSNASAGEARPRLG